MTRPASFNKTWAENVDPSQYSDESSESTQSFMNSGWEGGSDKKAPSAKTQNYMMRKVDLSLQEAERQGMLSWRNDVPYPAGARTWFHGSVFIALKDNVNVEPQGGSDNQTWFLQPVSNYPATWDNVSNKPATALRWPSFDEITNKPPYGDIVFSNKIDFDYNGAAIAASKDKIVRDGVSIVGLTQGDPKGQPYMRPIDKDFIVELAKKIDIDNLGSSLKEGAFRDVFDSDDLNALNGNSKVISAATVGVLKDRYKLDYLKSAAYKESTDFDASGEASKVQSNLNLAIQNADNTYPKRDNIIYVGIAAGNKEYPYMRTSKDEYVGLALKDKTDELSNSVSSLSTVAKSGSYTDLINKPNLGDASTRGVWDSDDLENLQEGSELLVSTGTLKVFRDRLRLAGVIGTYALAMRADGGNEIRFNQLLDGSKISPSSCSDSPSDRLTGVWRCLGWAWSASQTTSGPKRTTLWVRIS